MKWGVEILTNTFTKVKNGKEFPLDWKTAKCTQFIKKKEIVRNQESHLTHQDATL
jgi:aromatic ring-opening dioxygenase LigB subunit